MFLANYVLAAMMLTLTQGCIACGWIAEKWGRRAAILGICLVSFV